MDKKNLYVSGYGRELVEFNEIDPPSIGVKSIRDVVDSLLKDNYKVFQAKNREEYLIATPGAFPTCGACNGTDG